MNTNNNTPELWVYSAIVTLPTGERVTVPACAKHLEYEETGIGTRTHIREQLRKSYKARYVRVNKRIGTTTRALAKKDGVTIVSTSKSAIAASIKSRDVRVGQAQERKDLREKLAAMPKEDLLALLTNA